MSSIRQMKAHVTVDAEHDIPDSEHAVADAEELEAVKISPMHHFTSQQNIISTT